VVGEESSSTTAELAKGVSSVFDRLSEFFHIFDLSYIVSGVAMFGALSFLYLRNYAPQPIPFAPWVGVAALIVACYICGLLSFALGRLINTEVFRKRVMKRTVRSVIAGHGLTAPVMAKYAETKEGDRSLYTRLWAEVSNNHSEKAVFRHLLRYWVMAATYDGVGAALLIWAAVLLACGCPWIITRPLAWPVALTGFFAFFAASALAFHRGAGYLEYQLEDLIATLAAAKEPLL
jgi:hypothetical protein